MPIIESEHMGVEVGDEFELYMAMASSSSVAGVGTRAHELPHYANALQLHPNGWRCYVGVLKHMYLHEGEHRGQSHLTTPLVA